MENLQALRHTTLQEIPGFPSYYKDNAGNVWSKRTAWGGKGQLRKLVVRSDKTVKMAGKVVPLSRLFPPPEKQREPDPIWG